MDARTWAQRSCLSLESGLETFCQIDLDQLVRVDWARDPNVQVAANELDKILETEGTERWLVSMRIPLTPSETLESLPLPEVALARMSTWTPPGFYVMEPSSLQLPGGFEEYRIDAPSLRDAFGLRPDLEVSYSCLRTLEARDRGWGWDPVVWCRRFPQV